MGKIAGPEEITAFLRQVKALIEVKRRRLQERRKNLEDLALLGLTQDEMWRHVSLLTYVEYLEGPEPDDSDEYLGQVEWWVFGTTVGNEAVYIKLRIQDNEVVICLSFHIAEYPFNFPYFGLGENERGEKR